MSSVPCFQRSSPSNEGEWSFAFKNNKPQQMHLSQVFSVSKPKKSNSRTVSLQSCMVLKPKQSTLQSTNRKQQKLEQATPTFVKDRVRIKSKKRSTTCKRKAQPQQSVVHTNCYNYSYEVPMPLSVAADANTKTLMTLPIYIAVSHNKGRRAYMEDRHAIVPPHSNEVEMQLKGLCQHRSRNLIFCGVYDGHNGSKAAQYMVDHFSRLLENKEAMRCVLQQPSSSPLSPEEVSCVKQSIQKTYHQVEQEILSMTLHQGSSDGTTALTCCIVGDHVFMANVGDTRAVLAQHNGKVKRLSIDHKPNVQEEKDRIEQSGGKVVYSGCWRVAHEKIPVRLAISRSLGDHPLKTNLPLTCSAPLVSCEPHLCTFKMSPQNDFIILASDGVWDRISDVEAVEIVREEMERAKTRRPKETWDHCVQQASHKLVQLAWNRRSFDNVTAMVVYFQWKRSYASDSSSLPSLPSLTSSSA